MVAIGICLAAVAGFATRATVANFANASAAYSSAKLVGLCAGARGVLSVDVVGRPGYQTRCRACGRLCRGCRDICLGLSCLPLVFG